MLFYTLILSIKTATLFMHSFNYEFRNPNKASYCQLFYMYMYIFSRGKLRLGNFHNSFKWKPIVLVIF